MLENNLITYFQGLILRNLWLMKAHSTEEANIKESCFSFAKPQLNFVLLHVLDAALAGVAQWIEYWLEN